MSSLGLGHATRSLVLIHAFLAQGYQITIVSTGNALAFLRLELADCTAIDWQDRQDYPPLERGMGWQFYRYLIQDLIKTWSLIQKEHREFEKNSTEYDFIFSDGRYGFYSKWTPSFILSHQIAFVPPKGLKEISWLSDHLNAAALKKFDQIFIPDYPCPSNNLSGNLSHTPVLNDAENQYIGILSSYPHLNLKQDIDYLFVISGYLKEHKDTFVKSLLQQARQLAGIKVFILGDAEANEADYQSFEEENLTIYPLASGLLRQELFNRAKCIISRAGYTTVMDLVEHGKQALLIPTPNQTEQEYLGYYLHSLNHFISKEQTQAFDLCQALDEIQKTKIFTPPWQTTESVSRIRESMDRLIYKNFFTIIIPAHNEEKELGRTLEAILAQRYPSDRFEIIIVENGSLDATWAIAEQFVATHQSTRSIQLLRSALGVSNAKNAGLAQAAAHSEWVIFCDADTQFAPHALHQINTWINRHGTMALSVGTTRVLPAKPAGSYAWLWFSFYDFMHRLTRSSYAIQVARTPIARGIGFDPELSFSEDLVFIRECRRYGRFFFIPSDQVSTSVRRFEAKGYFRQGFRWLIEALMPVRMKKNRSYDVVR
ncbi:MAG: glycosyltransferase [Halothiobacillus sp.]